MKIAVTGYKGRLGSALCHAGCTPILSDITHFEELESEIGELNPDVIINCAAKSRVQWCEENPKECLAVNYRGVVNVRKAFSKYLVHISTDWIFDGKSGPYSETAKPSPLNSYGWSKWGAEIMLSAYAELHSTIVRTTMLYDSVSDNFVTQVLRSISNDSPFLASPDMFGSPTYIPFLVQALLDLITRKLDYIHVINIAGTTWLSRFEFAKKVAGNNGTGWIVPGLPPGLYETTKYPKKAGFDLSLAKKLHIPLHSLDEGLNAFHRVSNAA